ncbi:hypothetical protein ACWGNE_02140 [Streptomyces xiamenensis]
MSPSSTNRPTPTMTELHTALGSLLEALANAGITELLEPKTAWWSIGRTSGATVALTGNAVGGFRAARLGDLAALVEGTTAADRGGLEHSVNHLITGTWRGIPTELSVWTRRNAAEADTQGGAA